MRRPGLFPLVFSVLQSLEITVLAILHPDPQLIAAIAGLFTAQALLLGVATGQLGKGSNWQNLSEELVEKTGLQAPESSMQDFGQQGSIDAQ
jgi:hypothetical protein